MSTKSLIKTEGNQHRSWTNTIQNFKITYTPEVDKTTTTRDIKLVATAWVQAKPNHHRMRKPIAPTPLAEGVAGAAPHRGIQSGRGKKALPAATWNYPFPRWRWSRRRRPAHHRIRGYIWPDRNWMEGGE